jgi:hypothetical protein
VNRWNIPAWLEAEVLARDLRCVYCGVAFAVGGPSRRHRPSWEHIINDAQIVSRENIARCACRAIQARASRTSPLGCSPRTAGTATLLCPSLQLFGRLCSKRVIARPIDQVGRECAGRGRPGGKPRASGDRRSEVKEESRYSGSGDMNGGGRPMASARASRSLTPLPILSKGRESQPPRLANPPNPRCGSYPQHASPKNTARQPSTTYGARPGSLPYSAKRIHSIA